MFNAKCLLILTLLASVICFGCDDRTSEMMKPVVEEVLTEEPIAVADAADTFGDPFEGTTLQNPNWQWQNEPDNWDVGETRDGFLHIEGETNRDLWTSDASHFLYQETSADTFDVETHFFSRWGTSSGVNGLVVKSPADNNWVTIKFWSRDAGAKGHIQYQTRGQGLVADPAWRPEFGATELFLRLRKQGDTYTGWYKTRDADPWIEIGVANFPLTPPLQLGIYTGVAAPTGTLTVDYDYFRSTVDTEVLASPVLDEPVDEPADEPVDEEFTPFEGLTISDDGTVSLVVGRAIQVAGPGRCVFFDGGSLNGVRFDVHDFFWAYRADDNSDFRAIEGTESDQGICGYEALTEPGQYRVFLDFSMNGNRHDAVSQNVIEIK